MALITLCIANDGVNLNRISVKTSFKYFFLQIISIANKNKVILFFLVHIDFMDTVFISLHTSLFLNFFRGRIEGFLINSNIVNK